MRACVVRVQVKVENEEELPNANFAHFYATLIAITVVVGQQVRVESGREKYISICRAAVVTDDCSSVSFDFVYKYNYNRTARATDRRNWFFVAPRGRSLKVVRRNKNGIASKKPVVLWKKE